MGRIVAYVPGREAHRVAFRALNLAWIERHFVVEARDREELEDPEGRILAHGGHIVMAEEGDEVLGTCALIAEGDGVYELVKMAVREEGRGRGIGRALGQAVIDLARARGGTRVELLSNTALGPAIGLYRALGFVEVPLPANDYVRANIKMVLELGKTRDVEDRASSLGRRW
jgi:putative acetyltransferase